MRLLSFHSTDGVHAGVLDGDAIFDLGLVPMPVLLERGLAEIEREARAGPRVPVERVRLAAPVPRPPKFLAIALNYSDHVAESGMATPTFQTWFNKQSTCVVGSGDDVHVPRVSRFVDYEGELAFVIGRRARHVPATEAAAVIAGYTIVNDVTVRDWQVRTPTMTIGKSFDTHGPMGPWIVTGDELSDPQSLSIRTIVNGEVRQDGKTADMIFNCFEMVEHLSTAFTLEPGDVIATGTPAGIGATRNPRSFLAAGDVVRVEIPGIGALENSFVDEPA